ncbi:HDIG domain-containing metalloprotein [Streptomyces sp. NPDC028635]|uniref:HDIG domain-containing metalloprotein n=1 Tax=Streptomyces sp. NPDC028635 TaxID=3154800 RepID=UPI0033DBC2D2
MSLPSVDEIRALHEKYAPTAEAFDVVHTHCEIVWSVAEHLVARSSLRVDLELVRAGCLLHDIGVYSLITVDGHVDRDNYIRHGILGHEILRGEGYPEHLCRICSCHTGVGITKHDVVAQGLPLPPCDYVAESTEERLVMYADKFHSKTTPPKFLSAAAYARYVRRFGDEKVDAFDALRAEFGEPDVAALASQYGHALEQ